MRKGAVAVVATCAIAVLAVAVVLERSPVVMLEAGVFARPQATAPVWGTLMPARAGLRFVPGQQLAVGGVDIEGGQGESDAIFGSHDDHSTYGIAGSGWQGAGNGENPGELWNPAIAPGGPRGQQLLMRASYPSADAINSELEDLYMHARGRKGEAAPKKGAIAKLHATVTALQDMVLRDPQSRSLVARRLAVLRGAILGKSQKLQDYTGVYLAPEVDDLDNYLQVTE